MLLYSQVDEDGVAFELLHQNTTYYLECQSSDTNEVFRMEDHLR